MSEISISMKYLSKIGFLLILLFNTSLFTSCSRDCSDSVFELSEISLTPRSFAPGNTVTESWDNDAALPVNRLIVRINMEKEFLSRPDLDSDCFPKYKIDNRNRVSQIRLLSNQGFNQAYPAGSDLFGLCLFAPQPGNYISREDFIEGYVNESNFKEFFFVFNQSPDVQAFHNLTMQVIFEDGSIVSGKSISSTPIAVLLSPVEQ